ncbi:D-2-hydroxyacid dehydrogenase [Kribbella deserti]|uniref:D-2-hydroxyacid dehydrogenase n=1 Tax=Kribbella deserti TaxID=1926257 RepID=A0ABV6QIR8_9ACTN
MKLVLVPPQVDATRDWPERLMADVPGWEVVRPPCEAMRAELQTADAAYGVLTPDLLTESLKWLQAPQAAPPPGYFFPELVDHPVVVTNMRDTYTDHVAAHTLALVLAMCRGLPLYFRDQRDECWAPDWDPASVVTLPEATALIVGAGAVGAEVGRLLSEFGTTVIGVDARTAGPLPGFARVEPAEALDALLPTADLVILTVPHTPATEGFFDAKRFALLRPSAYFVNVGRGPTVQLDALMDALEADRLAGAALDVFETEPLPPGHPLWRRPDVLITPHVAGVGPHADERRYAVLRDNARRFASGLDLVNLVDKAAWF